MDKELRPDDPRVAELAKHDPWVQWMVAHHKPITRQTYIELEYMFGEVPHPWTAEHEHELPELLQDHSQVQR